MRKSYPKLTPTQQYEKTYRAYDEWVKKDMLKNADKIEAMLQEMEAERGR